MTTIQPLDIAIDVSDNNERQSKIDWPAVAAAGIRIAFVKAMEGVGMHYPTWGPQSEGAHRAGLVVIPYLFLRRSDPKQTVNAFQRVTGLSKGDPFALDWEGRGNQTETAPAAEQIGEELAIIAGRKPIGYWGQPGSSPAAPTAKMQQWPRWVPRYPMTGVNSFYGLPEKCKAHPELYWHAATGALPEFAQYSAWGRVPGVPGLVDRSVAFFPSVADALAWCTGNPAQRPQDAVRPVSGTTVAPGAASPHQAALATGGEGDASADELNAQELARLARQ